MSSQPDPEQQPHHPGQEIDDYVRRRGRPAPTEEELHAAEQERQAQIKASVRQGVDAGVGRLDDAPVPESFDAAIRGAIEDRRQRRHGL